MYACSSIGRECPDGNENEIMLFFLEGGEGFWALFDVFSPPRRDSVNS